MPTRSKSKKLRKKAPKTISEILARDPDDLTPLLCEAVDLLEQHGLVDKCTPKLWEWAKKHEEEETERIAKGALEKLTPRERRALGLHERVPASKRPPMPQRARFHPGPRLC